MKHKCWILNPKLGLSGLTIIGIIFSLFCIRPLPSPDRVVLIVPANKTVLSTAGITFLWDPVEEAERYLLQVATDTKFHSLSIEDTTTQTTTFAVLETDGNYWWRVRAQNNKGVWGEWSEANSFTLQRFSIINSVKTQGYPHDIAVQANRGYIADGQAGLVVYDLTNPVSPRFLGQIMDSLNIAWGVAVRDSFVFLAYGYKELMVVNAKQPESLKIIGVLEYPQPGYGYDIALQDSWVYIAAGAQFIVVNVIDPRYPNLRFQYYYPRGCRGVVGSGRDIFLACEQLGIATWRADTFPPVQIGAMDTPGNARGVAFKDGVLYVADGRSGLVMIDAADPGNMERLTTFSLDGYASSVTVDDTFAFVACGSGGVAVVNCANPLVPYLTAQIKTPYAYAVGLIPGTQYILILDRDLGIITIKKEF